MSHPAYKEAHPLGYRVTHLVHLISMVALAFTGFFIHFPFANWAMQPMRTIHFIAMFVVLINLVTRVLLALVGRTAALKGSREVSADWHNFLPQSENRGQFFQTIKYYLFLRKSHPPSAKYNPLQKLAYVLMGALLVVQGYTGFAIYGPTDAWPLFALGTTFVGGLMRMREIHYFIMWVFIAITMIHVYLSVAEDVDQMPLMFFGKETAPER